MNTERLAASTRIALAAYLHDLGKFAERARIPEADAKDDDGNTRADECADCSAFAANPAGRG